MLTIEPVAFNKAVEALMVAARSATDSSGLKVLTDTPRVHNTTVHCEDWRRIRAIALGAVVALVNGAAHPGDEVHL